MIPEKIQHMPANTPTTEAVIALSKDRSFLLQKRAGLNTMWAGYPDAVREFNDEILNLDKRIDRLIEDERFQRLPRV